MANSIDDLLEGISFNNDLLVDIGGKAYSAKDYIRHYHKGMSEQYKRNAIPSTYEFPTGFQLELTHKCNQRCVHCYNQSGGNERPDLPLEQWKQIAHQVGKMGVFQCVISGGEPTLLGDGLFEILDILNDYDIKIILITNGMLIDEKKIKRLAKYKYSWFQVSIDGSRPELHNYVRGVDSWEKAVNAANLVKTAGIPLVIAHAVVKKNIDYLEEMIDMAYLLGAAKITTGPFSYMGRAVLNSEELELNSDEIKRVYQIANKKAVEYQGRLQVAVSSEEVIALRTKLIEPNGVLLVRPNGDVKFDCVAPFKLGNVNEESLYDIWNRIGRDVMSHPRFREYVLSIKGPKDMLNVRPRINVDPDELLLSEGNEVRKDA